MKKILILLLLIPITLWGYTMIDNVEGGTYPSNFKTMGSKIYIAYDVSEFEQEMGVGIETLYRWNYLWVTNQATPEYIYDIIIYEKQDSVLAETLKTNFEIWSEENLKPTLERSEEKTIQKLKAEIEKLKDEDVKIKADLKKVNVVKP